MYHHTPESLLPRTDSKNPNSTCHGLSSNGKPCRRGLSKSPHSSPSPSPSRGALGPDAFCWQHKDQAGQAAPPIQPRPNALRERSSVDTLVERLGLLEVDQKKNKGKQRQTGEENRGRRPGSNSALRNEQQHVDSHVRPQRQQQAQEWQQAQAQAQAHQLQEPGGQEHHDPSFTNGGRTRRKRSNLELLCCGEPDDSDAPRPQQKMHEGPSSSHVPSSHTSDHLDVPSHSTRPSSRPNTSSSRPSHSKQPEMLQRPTMDRDPSSRTGELLAHIPSSASPQTTAALLAELAKPISDADLPGFIYMFWLTDEGLPTGPSDEAAGSLLAPTTRSGSGHRRTSDVLESFTSAPPDKKEKTMLLKIGRAENVFARMQQWKKQCGYNLALIRYYPYHDSSKQPSRNPSENDGPKKVPNVHKVERLIHIELMAKRVNCGKCKTCGKEHREWFEIDANRDGVTMVDEVIKRWVDWAEKDEASRHGHR
ncbi:3f5cd977-7bff-4c03-b092-0b92e15d8c89-CDS [Sclerotinia trifoliorum]|uniref:3f5cd977-7bff-4c03-b092-0b92e15d8c89-CDS n=1 Tax=Sclerotinia trifoliorum TaxID=28548 RepID=A0A8H2W7E0_9HELO|nr:3f5cd977-7bff-4c03-b092-0b92e15d8c89-CDS [Sclerotinia trifoliorum]